jgi:hypothetical protein
LTVSLVHLAGWAEDGQTIPKNFHVLSFDSSVTVLLSNRVAGFAWIGLALAFVNKCSQKQEIITIFHHLSSSLVYCTAESRNFFIEPPPDTQRKERQGERGMWVAMSCYLPHATPPFPPSPLPLYRASVALPAATLSGLAEGRLLPPPLPTYPPLLNLNSFQRPRPKARMASI